MTCLDSRSARNLVSALLLLVTLTALGCGLRESQTGGLTGCIVNVDGDIVENATVYSLFNEADKAITGKDGSFYLSELPAGLNRIIITHASYATEERTVEIHASELTRVEYFKLDQTNASKRISQTRVESVTSSTAQIAWTTYKPLACEVEYGPDQNYGKTLEESEAVEEHNVTIPGLTPESIYHARIRFIDVDSVLRYSYDLPFKTSEGDAPSPPTNVRIGTLITYGVIPVEWNISTSSSVVGYRIMRREDSADWVVITTDTLDRNTIRYEDKTAKGGKFYEYAVAAVSNQAALSQYRYSSKVFMPGYINQDLTLKVQDSPVKLVSDLIVGIGVNLYVEPGVEFQVASSDAFKIGIDPNRVEILVQGRTSIVGTKALPVKFTSLDGVAARDHWAGITLQKSEIGESELAFIEIFGCKDYAVFADGIGVNLHDVSIRYCGSAVGYKGIRLPPSMTGCLFQDIASSAVSVVDCRRFVMSNCIMENVDVGIHHVAYNPEDRLTVTETTVEAITAGVSGIFSRSVFANCLFVVPEGIGFRYINASETTNYLDHCTINALIGVQIENGVPIIENNIITSVAENGTSGIKVLKAGAPQISYNDLYGFTTLYDGCAEGYGTSRQKPDFVGGNPYDYHLQASSPLKTADKNGFEFGRYGLSFVK